MSASPHLALVVQPTQPTFRSLTLGYGNELVLRAWLPIRIQVPNPPTSWGPTTRLGTPIKPPWTSAPPHVRHRLGATAFPAPTSRPRWGSQSERGSPTTPTSPRC